MATILSPHAYALYRTYANIPLNGLSFTSQNTGEDLQNPNGASRFITKEGWLGFSNSNGGEWIETGTVKGALFKSFTDYTIDDWDGLFVAMNGCGGVTATQCSNHITYREGEVGSQVATGKHNFIIRKMTDGSGNYQVYIDYSPLIVVNGSTFTVSDPINADVGIESNDTTNSFTSGTTVYDFWIVDPNNENNSGTAGWYPVTPSISYTYTSSNNYNGADVKVQYPYDNGTRVPAGAVTQSNKITFTHN
ncbi:MAG: hypothetical protein PUP92_19000 [Rhizonema sp. PD38]|nr:hypothetical protein [Rhizonema sp. PD38]